MSTIERAQTPRVRVPPVLPQLRIQVDTDGALIVTLDRETYDVPAGWLDLGRDAARRIIDEVTRKHGPARVEVVESDGTVFTDIATPPTGDGEPEEPVAPSEPVPFETRAEGFLPEESVAVAVIAGDHSAGADGTARLHLPPALLAGRRGAIVLLGRTSGTISIVGAA